MTETSTPTRTLPTAWLGPGLRALVGGALVLAGLWVASWWSFESRAWLATTGSFVVTGALLIASAASPRLRRRWQWLGVVAGVLVLGPLLTVSWLLAAAPVSNVGKLGFENELAIPELAEPTIDGQGRLVFDLEAQHGQMSFLDGTTTQTMGINGDYLGPTLRAARGDDVVVNVTNHLNETTTIHWHGMHLPAAMDGGPHQVIEPHEMWSPQWTIDQPAGSLWYHPHLHGRTGAHVYGGLAGMFIIDDDESADLGLPDVYGVDDIPLIVQDRLFDDEGQFRTAETLSSLGVLGDEILVNGTHDPYLEIAHRLVRLRVLNGSNDRIFDFGFHDERPFLQIATDGGLLEHPVDMQRLQVSPGERAELVVEFEPGDDVILRSFAPRTGVFPERRAGGADTFDIVRIIAADELTEAADIPERLTTIEPLAEPTRPTDRLIELGDGVINGRRMDMERIDHVIGAGTSEVWEISNVDGDPHNFHLHDKHFQVLDIDGQSPPPHLSGWHDTVFVPPGSTVRIATLFGEYTDPDLPYMLHCHLLTHEDAGMMAQFTIVDPADVEDAPRRIDTPGHHNGHDHQATGHGSQANSSGAGRTRACQCKQGPAAGSVRGLRDVGALGGQEEHHGCDGKHDGSADDSCEL